MPKATYKPFYILYITFFVLAILFVMRLVVGAAPTAVITVTNVNDSGSGSLRQALLDAASNDTITFDNALAGQTISLTSETLLIDKSLTIESDAVTPIKISGNFQFQVFSIQADITVMLKNLVIADGIASACAGIANSSDLSLDNVTVTNNRATFFGGGVCSFGPGVTINDSTFTSNTAGVPIRGEEARGGANGGAIFASVNALIINNSTFVDNQATGGSDVFQSHSSTSSDPAIGRIEISNSTFHGQVFNAVYFSTPASKMSITNALFEGGNLLNGGVMTVTHSLFDGGYIVNDKVMTVDHSVVRNGRGIGVAAGGSGLIRWSLIENNASTGVSNKGVLQIENTAIVSNVVSFSGRSGGIYNQGSLTLTNVTLSNNQAPDGASAIMLAQPLFTTTVPTAYLNNVTITGNGGAVTSVISAETANTITFRNTIIADNNNANNCATVTGGSVGKSLGNSLSDDMTCTLDNATDLANNSQAELAPLADNGGGTLTHALLASSAAIDAGGATTCEALDQRGFSRPIDGDDDMVAICDMGAFEYLSSEPSTYTIFLPTILK